MDEDYDVIVLGTGLKVGVGDSQKTILKSNLTAPRNAPSL